MGPQEDTVPPRGAKAVMERLARQLEKQNKRAKKALKAKKTVKSVTTASIEEIGASEVAKENDTLRSVSSKKRRRSASKEDVNLDAAVLNALARRREEREHKSAKKEPKQQEANTLDVGPNEEGESARHYSAESRDLMDGLTPFLSKEEKYKKKRRSKRARQEQAADEDEATLMQSIEDIPSVEGVQSTTDNPVEHSEAEQEHLRIAGDTSSSAIHVKDATEDQVKITNSSLPEIMRERLIRTIKSASGLRSKISDDKTVKQELLPDKKSKKKKKDNKIEDIKETIEGHETQVDEGPTVVEAGNVKIIHEGVGEAVWGRRSNSTPILLYSSGIERSTAPSPELTPSVLDGSINITADKSETEVTNVKKTHVPPPNLIFKSSIPISKRAKSMADLTTQGHKDPKHRTSLTKSTTSYPAILPPTRGLKHGSSNAPTPILPPVVSPIKVGKISKSTPVIETLKKPHLKRALSTTSSEGAERVTSSKRRRKVSFQGSPITPSDMNSVMLTEQEVWEVNGGRFRGRVNLSDHRDSGDDAEIDENIAYSSSYIHDRAKPIKIGKTAFSIVRLFEGQSVMLTSDNEQHGLMICSVARGRADVRVDNNRFGIGEEGMWRIRPGETCRVKNRMNVEVVIHVTECA